MRGAGNPVFCATTYGVAHRPLVRENPLQVFPMFDRPETWRFRGVDTYRVEED